MVVVVGDMVRNLDIILWAGKVLSKRMENSDPCFNSEQKKDDLNEWTVDGNIREECLI